MILFVVAAIFVVLIVFSMPIVFALGVSGVAGLAIGGYDMQVLASSMVSGSQSWVLLAIPAFVFAGGLMEKCGMSHALVDFARALVGWVKGGLGMSVIVVAYFFSDICGSKMAEVSALGSTLMPPLTKAGYKRQDSASLIAAGTAMGMLVPPAIFMIVIAQVTNTSAVALFLAGFVPAATIMVCLMVLVYFRARKYDWPVDTRPNPRFLWDSAKRAAVPLVIPIVILGGFFLGIFTATEAGAVVAGYAFIAARFYYRNVSFREMGKLAYESAILTAAVVFLLAVVALNLVMLPFYIVAIFVAGLGAVLFYAVNGWLTGRVYYEQVALRRLKPAEVKAWRRANSGVLWLTGIAIVFLGTLPILNLIVPVLGVAAMVHVAQTLKPPPAPGRPFNPPA